VTSNPNNLIKSKKDRLRSNLMKQQFHKQNVVWIFNWWNKSLLMILSQSMRSTWNRIKFMLTLIIFMKIRMMMKGTTVNSKYKILRINNFRNLQNFRFKLNKKLLVRYHAAQFVWSQSNLMQFLFNLISSK
jgi:hypothetical protein